MTSAQTATTTPRAFPLVISHCERAGGVVPRRMGWGMQLFRAAYWYGVWNVAVSRSIRIQKRCNARTGHVRRPGRSWRTRGRTIPPYSLSVRCRPGTLRQPESNRRRTIANRTAWFPLQLTASTCLIHNKLQDPSQQWIAPRSVKSVRGIRGAFTRGIYHEGHTLFGLDIP